MVVSKLRNIAKIPFGGFILAIPKPLEATEFYDVVDKDLKTAQSFKKFDDTETGWERIKRMFQLE